MDWETWCGVVKKRRKRMRERQFLSAFQIWKIHLQQLGQGPSQTWVATNTKSQNKRFYMMWSLSVVEQQKQGWSKQNSCHFPVKRKNYGWHNRMAFDDGQKKHRWTKPCLYEGWAGWLARWMKAGSSGHIWTGKIKSWNPQADLCSFWPPFCLLLLNQQLPVCANGKYNNYIRQYVMVQAYLSTWTYNMTNKFI